MCICVTVYIREVCECVCVFPYARVSTPSLARLEHRGTLPQSSFPDSRTPASGTVTRLTGISSGLEGRGRGVYSCVGLPRQTLGPCSREGSVPWAGPEPAGPTSRHPYVRPKNLGWVRHRVPISSAYLTLGQGVLGMGQWRVPE